MKIWQKTIVSVATFALLLNSLAAPLTVLAQEETPTPSPEATTEATPTPEATVEETATPEATPEVTPEEIATPTPEVTPEATDLVTPAPTDQAVVDQAPESNQTVQGPPASEQPTAVPTVTPVVSSALEVSPEVSTQVVTTNVFPETVTNNSWFKLITDKLDYSPTEAAIITGSNFEPNKTYSVTVNSTDDPATSTTVEKTTDENGGFTYEYQLDGNYRPNYKVEVKDGEIFVASTTFTDSATLSGISITNTSVTEGNSGTSTATFTISVTRGGNGTVSVNYATANGTATGGAGCSGSTDYVSKNGTLTWGGNDASSQTINVTICGDITVEADETFSVNLTSGSQGSSSFTKSTGQGTILNDDVAPGDTTPPVLSLPSNITIEATSASGAVVTFTATANDAIDGSRPVTCTPPSGSTFPLGTTTVNCSASDTHSNTANGSFTVTVRDTTAPTLTLPANITQEATGPSGKAVTFTATASDLVDDPVSVVCTPPSGSVFPVGTTTVSCSAHDSHSNTANGSFTVKIQDTTAPSVSMTSPSNGALVRGTITLSASASDHVGISKVEFWHSSPTAFEIGEDTTDPYSINWNTTTVSDSPHSVWAVAQDTSGNRTISTSVNLTVDNTAPTGAATIANNYYGPNTYNQLTTINGTASDTESGVDTVILSIMRNSTATPQWFTDCWQGWQWGGCDPLIATYDSVHNTWTYGGLPAAGGYLTDGISYQVYPIITDKAGNSATGTADVFTWDEQVPTSHVGTLSTSKNTKGFNVSYTADDVLGPWWRPMQKSGLKEVDLYYRFNGGSWTKYGTFASSPISFTAGSDGTYEFYTIARDNVLNEETAKTSTEASTIVDTTAPVIADHGNLTIEATGPTGAVVDYTSPATSDNIDPDGAATCSPVSGGTFALGDTTITCNATDAAGNAATPTTFVIHVVDTTAPTGSWLTPVDGSTVLGVTSLSFDASDDGSGIDGIIYSYSNDGINFPIISGDALDFTPLPLGSYTLRATVTDNAGNTLTQDETVLNLDVCTNIDGIQTSVPDGMHINSTGHECENWGQSGPAPRNDEGGAAVLGVSTNASATSWPKLAYAGNGEEVVLGATTSATATPAASPVVKGSASTNPGPTSWIMTHKKITFGVILALIILDYFIYRKRKSS